MAQGVSRGSLLYMNQNGKIKSLEFDLTDSDHPAVENGELAAEFTGLVSPPEDYFVLGVFNPTNNPYPTSYSRFFWLHLVKLSPVEYYYHHLGIKPNINDLDTSVFRPAYEQFSVYGGYRRDVTYAVGVFQ